MSDARAGGSAAILEKLTGAETKSPTASLEGPPYPLAKGPNYSIDVTVDADYTHSVRITLQPSGEVLQTIPIDPTDRTIAGSISKSTLNKLGSEAPNALKALSDALITHLGAKEFIMVPDDATLPQFAAPESFARFRHVTHADVRDMTDRNLQEHKALKAELDTHYYFVTDEKRLLADQNPLTRFNEIHHVLESQARFTPGKMTEYKEEDLQGKISRFKSAHVKPIVMLNKQKQIVGMIRVLLMGNQFVYLADEVMNQELLPLDRFSGAPDEQKKKREAFLFSYLMNKAAEVLIGQEHLFIIAASGRESIYDAAGFKAFPLALAGWKMVISLNPPKPILVRLQERIKTLKIPDKNPVNAAHREMSLLDLPMPLQSPTFAPTPANTERISPGAPLDAAQVVPDSGRPPNR